MSNFRLQRYGRLLGRMMRQLMGPRIKFFSSQSAQQKSKPLHVPVLVKEMMEILQPNSHQVYVDMTFGAGGHTRELLKHVTGCTVFVLDRDPQAYELAKRLASSPECLNGNTVHPMRGSFSSIGPLLNDLGVVGGAVAGFMFDIGASSMQMDEAQRGFSLSFDGPLDMRMDPTGGVTAAHVVNRLSRGDLRRIFKVYADERLARVIADHIAMHRATVGDIHSTQQLADVVKTALENNSSTDEAPDRKDSLGRRAHPATKIFQALRIFVNDELNELCAGLSIAHNFLQSGKTPPVRDHFTVVGDSGADVPDKIIGKHASNTGNKPDILPRDIDVSESGLGASIDVDLNTRGSDGDSNTRGGVCAVISFHSGEDRIVKHIFNNSPETLLPASGPGTPQPVDKDNPFSKKWVKKKQRNNPAYSGRGQRLIKANEAAQSSPRKRWKTITDLVTPSEQEVRRNSRARSGKLRAAVKL